MDTYLAVGSRCQNFDISINELYKMSSKPAIQTTNIVKPIDIAKTESAEFVYVKLHEPKHGLSPKFEGPFRVISRPTRSQVQVQVGSFVDGRPRLQVFHWTSCKIAHVREGANIASRPNIGRKPLPKQSPAPEATPPSPSPSQAEFLPDLSSETSSEGSTNAEELEITNNSPAKIQTNEAPLQNSRPIRASRNPNPRYIDSIATPA